MTYAWYRTTPIWKKIIIRLLGREKIGVVESGKIISYDFLGTRYLDRFEIKAGKI